MFFLYKTKLKTTFRAHPTKQNFAHIKQIPDNIKTLVNERTKKKLRKSKIVKVKKERN